MKKLIAIAMSASLAGCVTTPKPVKYTEPLNSTATLSIVYGDTKVEGDDKVAILHIYKQSEECKGKQFVGAMKPSEENKVGLPTGEPLSFSLTSYTFDRINDLSCKLYVTFTPEENTEYFATYSFGNEKCSLRLNGKNKDGYFPVDALKKRPHNGSLSDDPSWCR